MAGRIPQHFIDDLLDRVDIVEVIDRRVTLKKAGRNFKACCPFHDEKTPSFNVNPDKQFFHCFGCGAGGNAVGFIMDYENIDFPAAIETLASMAGLEVPREASNNPQQENRQQRVNPLYEALNFSARYYQNQLRQHSSKKQAVDYLKQRGLSGETARDFGIGYAPPGWDNLLQAARNQNELANLEQHLETVGLLIKKENGDYYDRFRDRVMFPIRDNRGRIIAFGGRVLGDDKPKYLNSPESAIFHKQRELYGLFESRKHNRTLSYLLMVEGYMDVVSLYQHGFNRAVATLGTASGATHLEKIFRHTSKLVVCFDGDAAGNKAAERVLENALPAMRDGREICFMFLPEGEDPDSYVLQHGTAAFEQLAETARPLEQQLLIQASANIQTDSDAGKARACQTALPLVKTLPQGIFKHRMLAQLAEFAGVSIELLQQQLDALPQRQQRSTAHQITPPTQTSAASAANSTNAAPKTSTTQNKAPQATAPNLDDETNQSDPALLWSIATLLHHPELARELTLPKAVSQNPVSIAKLLTTLVSDIQREFKQGNPSPSTATLLGQWHGEPEARVLVHCLNTQVAPENQQVAEKQLLDTLAKIVENAQQRNLDTLIASIAERSRAGIALSEQEKQTLMSLGQRPEHSNKNK
jgi:DNA primase